MYRKSITIPWINSSGGEGEGESESRQPGDRGAVRGRARNQQVPSIPPLPPSGHCLFDFAKIKVWLIFWSDWLPVVPPPASPPSPPLCHLVPLDECGKLTTKYLSSKSSVREEERKRGRDSGGHLSAPVWKNGRNLSIPSFRSCNFTFH